MRLTTREALVRGGWSLADSALAGLAVYGAAWLRYDLSTQDATRPPITVFAIAYGSIFIAIALVAQAFSRSHPRGTFEETAQLLRHWLLASVIAGPLVFLWPGLFIPRSLPFVAPLLAIVGMFALRFIVRSYRWGRPITRDSDRPVIVYGAGRGGRA